MCGEEFELAVLPASGSCALEPQSRTTKTTQVKTAIEIMICHGAIRLNALFCHLFCCK